MGGAMLAAVGCGEYPDVRKKRSEDSRHRGAG